MNSRELKAKLLRGERVYGTMLQSVVTPAIVDFFPAGALDFVILTAEHTTLDLAEFMPLRYALAAKEVVCLVRTHSRDPADVSRVCDTFDGVVVPYVEEVEHAKELAAAAVYRPLKGRALDQVLAGGAWPSTLSREYVEERNAGTLFIPMIESIAGVENLEAICAIPGVHAIFVGPSDLSVNMGIPRDYDHPDFIALLKRIIDKSERQHVAPGCWFGDIQQAHSTIELGVRFIVYSNEGSMLQGAVQQTFTKLRNP